jgi:16S rRNA (guanine966-N2)-methyltransferase
MASPGGWKALNRIRRLKALTSAARGADSRPPGEVRVIGGVWKRSKLPVPARDGLRPTPDRVRETLFNWLGQDLRGWRCLDAFAGCGALGFEAASRGARAVLMIERDPALAASLRAVQVRLGASMVRIECADALAWMARHTGESFDLVLLDPPFAAGLHESALSAARPLLAPAGSLYLESDRPLEPSAVEAIGLHLHRHSRAGRVHAHLLRAAATPGETP